LRGLGGGKRPRKRVSEGGGGGVRWGGGVFLSCTHAGGNRNWTKRGLRNEKKTLKKKYQVIWAKRVTMTISKRRS